MNIEGRVTRLRVDHGDMRATHLYAGRKEREEMHIAAQPYLTHANTTGAPDRFQGLEVVYINAPSFLAVGHRITIEASNATQPNIWRGPIEQLTGDEPSEMRPRIGKPHG